MKEDRELKYAFLGLNRYGLRLAHLIGATGAEILIADGDQDIINRYADEFTSAVCLDLSNSMALEKIELNKIDVAIVDSYDNLEAAIVSIMVAKEQGVGKVISTARSDRYRDVMLRVGADEVVIPEDLAAAQMAKLLISADFMTYYDIGGSLCILKVEPKREWINKSLKQLDLKKTEGINVIAFDRDGKMDVDVHADTIIPSDCLLVIALPKALMYEFI